MPGQLQLHEVTYALASGPIPPQHAEHALRTAEAILADTSIALLERNPTTSSFIHSMKDHPELVSFAEKYGLALVALVLEKKRERQEINPVAASDPAGTIATARPILWADGRKLTLVDALGRLIVAAKQARSRQDDVVAVRLLSAPPRATGAASSMPKLPSSAGADVGETVSTIACDYEYRLEKDRSGVCWEEWLGFQRGKVGSAPLETCVMTASVVDSLRTMVLGTRQVSARTADVFLNECNKILRGALRAARIHAFEALDRETLRGFVLEHWDNLDLQAKSLESKSAEQALAHLRSFLRVDKDIKVDAEPAIPIQATTSTTLPSTSTTTTTKMGAPSSQPSLQLSGLLLLPSATAIETAATAAKKPAAIGVVSATPPAPKKALSVALRKEFKKFLHHRNNDLGRDTRQRYSDIICEKLRGVQVRSGAGKGCMKSLAEARIFAAKHYQELEMVCRSYAEVSSWNSFQAYVGLSAAGKEGGSGGGGASSCAPSQQQQQQQQQEKTKKGTASVAMAGSEKGGGVEGVVAKRKRGRPPHSPKEEDSATKKLKEQVVKPPAMAKPASSGAGSARASTGRSKLVVKSVITGQLSKEFEAYCCIRGIKSTHSYLGWARGVLLKVVVPAAAPGSIGGNGGKDTGKSGDGLELNLDAEGVGALVVQPGVQQAVTKEFLKPSKDGRRAAYFLFLEFLDHLKMRSKMLHLVRTAN